MDRREGLPTLHPDRSRDDPRAIGEMAAVTAAEGAGEFEVLDRIGLSLCKVKVTSAFEPSPPLRQDCEEIRKPLMAGGSVEALGLSSSAVGSGAALACICPAAAGVVTAPPWTVTPTVVGIAFPVVWSTMALAFPEAPS